MRCLTSLYNWSLENLEPDICDRSNLTSKSRSDFSLEERKLSNLSKATELKKDGALQLHPVSLQSLPYRHCFLQL